MSYFHRGCFAILFWIFQICHGHYIISANEYSTGLTIGRNSLYNQKVSRLPRETPENPAKEELCKKFEEEEPDSHEFYSPGWPGPYPNRTDCVKVLEAPKGHLLRLDFREFFNLESSDGCDFDYLEVRDGAHGFGQLIGKYCGNEFPPMITSTERYLWLRFHSDDNIEYNGFKAVYEFIERPSTFSTPEVDACRIYLNGSEGLFSSDDIPQERRDLTKTYNIALDCMWIITVKEGWRIRLTFPVFKLEKPNDCESNFVDVFSDRTDLPKRKQNLCGSIADNVISDHNLMFIRFLAESKARGSKFQALFTAYRDKTTGAAACEADEFDCDDATCISKELKCNGRINCRLRWDEHEDECRKKTIGMLNSEHIIIIMVIFSLILTGMCITFMYNCVRKLIRDHRTIQEHIRQSREQQLNVLGHKGIDERMEAKKVLTDRSLSNSSHSSPSQKFDAGAKESSPCYVPGGEMLPILIKGTDPRYNGDPYGMMTQTHEGTYQSERSVGREPEQCEMCDSACQTRESLFDPPVQHEPTPIPHPSPPAPFSTFGYKKENKYRAEGKIRIEKVDNISDKRGPYSIQSTKSAPDVIVTH